jgi:rhamnosyltransferase
MSLTKKYRVAVLLATYNGAEYVNEQLASIDRQRACEIDITVSDDGSTDDTECLINKFNFRGPNKITILPKEKPSGSAGANFRRLICSLKNPFDHDAVAFADQDDIWLEDHLEAAIDSIVKYQVDGVSSPVEAFWPNGTKQICFTAGDLKKYDYLFESAGPGCTYVMTPRLISEAQINIHRYSDSCNAIYYHDWMVYAMCRALGMKWLILDKTFVRYRQHSSNEIGVRTSLRGLTIRLNRIVSGWHGQQYRAVYGLLDQIGVFDKNDLSFIFTKPRFLERVKLAVNPFKYRRNLGGLMLFSFIVITGLMWISCEKIQNNWLIDSSGCFSLAKNKI